MKRVKIAFICFLMSLNCLGQKKPSVTYSYVVKGEGNRPTAIIISEPIEGKELKVLYKNKKGDTVYAGYDDWKTNPITKPTKIGIKSIKKR